MTDISAAGLESPKRSYLKVLLPWFRHGVRTGVFRQPRWEGLHTDAFVMAGILVAAMLITLLLQRLSIDGPATFYWQAVEDGWLGTLLSAWACCLVCGSDALRIRVEQAPGPALLFTQALAQATVLSAAFGLAFVALNRVGAFDMKPLGYWLQWAMWLAPGIWMAIAEIVLLWRGGDRRRGPMALAVLTVAGGMVLSYAVRPADYWYPAETDEPAAANRQLKLTQELMETQHDLLADRLDELVPQRPGIADIYAVTFAPYAQDVFRRESDLVTQVMAQRFDAEGRALQLVNHVDTPATWPWATPLNLKRAIERIAQTMDRDEDVLFIHLTSHGAADGELAARFWPLELDELRPADLKRWLDDAGIRYRVISVSACYSGSWIAPLAGDGTLVMTAADAEHTSYGCGSKSELTFFGRAMYDEQLRNATLSFEEAHRAARDVIKKREEEAGKDDGYSNPQMRMGTAIDKVLAAQRERLKTVTSR